ncbi:MAG: Hsp20 family protein [Pseudomonadales bacterium]|nr:Hsp20 family protein [Pseudomonadales bacterium]
MNTFDISPFFRSTVGFDRLFNQLDHAWQSENTWPQYDVLKTNDEEYRITVALPGYQISDLHLEVRDGVLTVKGERNVDPNHNQYLYRGIGGQSFTRNFQLAEYVKVTHARLRDGLLQIDLRRELPESMLPKRIEVTGDEPDAKALTADFESKAA